MALKACKECGHNVSTSAESCPSCGAPIKKRRSGGRGGGCLLGVVAFFVLAALIATCEPPGYQEQPTSIEPSKPVVPVWTSRSQKDQMTGDIRGVALSPNAGPTQKQDFPLHNLLAWLNVNCSGSREWAAIGFTSPPNLIDDETRDGYNLIQTRLRWDSTIHETTLLQEWGSDFLQFDEDAVAIQRIQAGETVLLELNWYSHGRIYFEFDLTGSSAAIAEMRRICRGQ